MSNILDILISFIKGFSSDEVSHYSRSCIEDLCGFLNGSSTDFIKNIDIYKKVNDLSLILADENIFAGVSCLELVNGLAFISMPSLKGGGSWPSGGGQPFEFYWHLKNTYFKTLCKIAWMAYKRSDEEFDFAIEKLIFELKIVKDFYQNCGRKEVDVCLKKLLRAMDNDSVQKYHVEQRLRDIGFA